jgi:ABC-type glycerol-3-phosphate transport system substrate-binding protein
MKNSSNQSQARAFLNWWIMKDVQKQGMLLFDQFPIYSSMYSDKQLATFVKKSDGQDSYAIYGKQFDYAQARPNFNGYVDASQKLQVQLHKVYLGQESPQKAMDTAAQQMQAASGGGNNP